MANDNDLLPAIERIFAPLLRANAHAADPSLAFAALSPSDATQALEGDDEFAEAMLLDLVKMAKTYRHQDKAGAFAAAVMAATKAWATLREDVEMYIAVEARACEADRREDERAHADFVSEETDGLR